MRIPPLRKRCSPRNASRLTDKFDRVLWSSERRSAFKGLKRSLYPYQREGVARFLAEGRLLLADDMGLGKTAQAIASPDILWRTNGIEPRFDHRPRQPQAPVGQGVVAVLRPADRRGRRLAPEAARPFYQTHKTGLLIINC